MTLKTPTNQFRQDLDAIRKRARQRMKDGAVTPSYPLDVDTVVGLLNDALATELTCVMRYRRHHHTASGIHSEAIKAEFLLHANEELAHADALSKRIVQLGGKPDWSPKGAVERSHADYTESADLRVMVEDNLYAERIAIESYRAMIAAVGEDATTRRLLEGILAVEEEHAEDMASLLQSVG